MFCLGTEKIEIDSREFVRKSAFARGTRSGEERKGKKSCHIFREEYSVILLG